MYEYLTSTKYHSINSSCSKYSIDSKCILFVGFRSPEKTKMGIPYILEVHTYMLSEQHCPSPRIPSYFVGVFVVQSKVAWLLLGGVVFYVDCTLDLCGDFDSNTNKQHANEKRLQWLLLFCRIEKAWSSNPPWINTEERKGAPRFLFASLGRSFGTRCMRPRAPNSPVVIMSSFSLLLLPLLTGWCYTDTLRTRIYHIYDDILRSSIIHGGGGVAVRSPVVWCLAAVAPSQHAVSVTMILQYMYSRQLQAKFLQKPCPAQPCRTLLNCC